MVTFLVNQLHLKLTADERRLTSDGLSDGKPSGPSGQKPKLLHLMIAQGNTPPQLTFIRAADRIGIRPSLPRLAGVGRILACRGVALAKTVPRLPSERSERAVN